MAHCIRGCTRPNIDRETGEVGEPIPRIASDGLLCKKDAENLAHWLAEIESLYATLDVRIERSAEREGGGKRGKLSGSPALIRLDVLALTDPRTNPGDGMAGPDGKKEPNDGLVYVPQTVSGWAEMLALEQHLSMVEVDEDGNEWVPPFTLSDALSLLRTWLPTVLSQPWVDEFYGEMKDVFGLLSRALGIPRPRIVGHCISIIGEGEATRACGKALYAREGTAVIRCSACGRTYNGLDIVRLRTIEKHESGDTVRLPEKTA
jgi:hypothetical protein